MKVSRRTLIIAGLLLFVLLALFIVPALLPSEEKRLRARLIELIDAAENKDLDKLFDGIADDAVIDGFTDKADARNRAEKAMPQLKDLSLSHEFSEFQISGDEASGRIAVWIKGTWTGSGVYQSLPIQGYRSINPGREPDTMMAHWRRDADRWVLTSLTWVKP